MGIGLAVGALVDATIVRAVPLPATMNLLGDWKWYLPVGSTGQVANAGPVERLKP